MTGNLEICGLDTPFAHRPAFGAGKNAQGYSTTIFFEKRNYYEQNRKCLQK